MIYPMPAAVTQPSTSTSFGRGLTKTNLEIASLGYSHQAADVLGWLPSSLDELMGADAAVAQVGPEVYV
jgi:hypothetical protein